MRNSYQWPSLPPLSWLRCAWKRKYVILLAWAVMGGLAAAIVYSLPAVYRAEAVVLVESQRIPARFVTPTVTSDLNDRLATLRQQILSYSRLLAIVNKYSLYRDKRQNHPEEEIIDMMRQDTDVKLDRGWSQEQPGAFRISYESQNAAQAAQVANELAEAFIDQNLRSREINAVGTAEFLQDQVAEAKHRLEEQEARLTEYKRTHNGELPQQESTIAASLSRLQLQLQNVDEQLSRAKQNKTLRDSDLETALASQSDIVKLTEEAADAKSSGGPGAPAREKESALLERQLAAIRARYTDNHPDVKVLREAVDRAKAREAAQVDDAPAVPQAPAAPSNSSKPLLSGTLVAQRERVEQLKTLQSVTVKQIEDLQRERGSVLREMGSVQARLQQLPVREQQMASLARDYEISKANYQSLLDKQLNAQMATEMEKNQKSERFTVLDSARVPEKPVRPNRLLLSVAGVSGALLLSICIGFAVEFRKNVLLGEWELPEGTPVLGRVPRIQMRSDSSSPSLRQPSSPTVIRAT